MMGLLLLLIGIAVSGCSSRTEVPTRPRTVGGDPVGTASLAYAGHYEGAGAYADIAGNGVGHIVLDGLRLQRMLPFVAEDSLGNPVSGTRYEQSMAAVALGGAVDLGGEWQQQAHTLYRVEGTALVTVTAAWKKPASVCDPLYAPCDSSVIEGTATVVLDVTDWRDTTITTKFIMFRTGLARIP
jgi:hypothetical protein